MRFIFAGIIWLGTVHAAAAFNCDTAEETVLETDRRCEAEGFRVKRPGKECDKSSWEEAKQNIDWVIFSDRGAQGTYQEALRCLAADPFYRDAHRDVGPELSYYAILLAQGHNLSAQCSISLCRWNYTSLRGYYKKLKEARALPRQGDTEERRVRIQDYLDEEMKEAREEERRDRETDRYLDSLEDKETSSSRSRSAPAASGEDFDVNPSPINRFGDPSAAPSTPRVGGPSNIRIAPSLQR